MTSTPGITLAVEQLAANIIRQERPEMASLVIEGADQTVDLPHPVYISVMIPEDGTEPDLPTGPIYKVRVDIIRMAYWKCGTHLERKQAVGSLQRIFQKNPPPYSLGGNTTGAGKRSGTTASQVSVPGLRLHGWFIESCGGADVGDYVGDGMRVVFAVEYH